MTTGKQGETRSADKSQGKNASCREGNERVTSAVNQVVKRQTQPSRVVRPPHIFPAQKQFFVWFGTQPKRLVSVYIGPTPQSSPHWRPRPLTPPVPPSNRVNVIHRRPAVSFVWRESWLPCKCKRVAAIIVSSPLTLLQRGELSDKMTQSSCPSKHKFWKFQKNWNFIQTIHSNFCCGLLRISPFFWILKWWRRDVGARQHFSNIFRPSHRSTTGGGFECHFHFEWPTLCFFRDGNVIFRVSIFGKKMSKRFRLNANDGRDIFWF